MTIVAVDKRPFLRKLIHAFRITLLKFMRSTEEKSKIKILILRRRVGSSKILRFAF